MPFRPKEIEELSNFYLLHPASHRLAKTLAKTSLHPNAVSLTGMFCGLFAAFFYYHYLSIEFVWIGFVLMIIWHIMDGADGHLARLTGKASASGKVMDGIADYTVYLAVYVALTLALIPIMGIKIIVITLLAAVSHIFQAAACERERETYLFWVYGNEQSTIQTITEMPKNFILYYLYFAYIKTQNFLDVAKETKTTKGISTLSPLHQELISEKYKELYTKYMHQWWILGANAHTGLLFIFALFQKPFYYFIFELSVLNAILLFLLLRKKKLDKKFLIFLETNKFF